MQKPILKANIVKKSFNLDNIYIGLDNRRPYDPYVIMSNVTVTHTYEPGTARVYEIMVTGTTTEGLVETIKLVAISRGRSPLKWGDAAPIERCSGMWSRSSAYDFLTTEGKSYDFPSSMV